VIVVGVGRGEAFPVCVEKKKCSVHWGADQRAAKKRAQAAAKSGKTGEDRWALERRKQEERQKREEAERVRWKKALPAILSAVAEAVKKAPTKASGHLAEIILAEVASGSRYGNEFKLGSAASYVPRGTTAEDLVRHAAFLALALDAGSLWSAPRDFPRKAKAFGIDVARILNEAVPAEPAADHAETKAKTKTSRKAKAKRG
jgi:hypothetical protein